MKNMQTKKILVIGSKGHDLATRCVDWLEPFPYLGDYHNVIFNMQTLTDEVIEKLLEKAPVKFHTVQEDVLDAIWGNTTITCVTQEPLDMDSLFGLDNYQWCPISLSFKTREGKRFEKDINTGYLRYVRKWSHFLETYSLPHYYKSRSLPEHSLVFQSILKNMSGKSLAFEIRIKEYIATYTGLTTKSELSQPLYFLPPTTEIPVHDGINLLIKTLAGRISEDIQLPNWAKKISLPGEAQILTKTKKYREEIDALKAQITEHNNNLGKLERYKGLLTADGETLEEVVDEALEFLDINVERGPIKKEDRVFSEEDATIPIEIKGRKASIPEKDLRQIIVRLRDENSKTYKTRGMLVGNHYKLTQVDNNLKGREKAFEPNVVEQAKKFDICLVSTLEIFRALRKKLAGEDIGKFKKTLFNTVGEFTLE